MWIAKNSITGTFYGKKFKDIYECQHFIDTELHKLACARWQRNNIIRCWYVEQNRFADGFEF